MMCAQDQKLVLFCNNPLTFQSWLENNPLIQELLQKKSYLDMIDCLMNVSTEEEEVNRLSFCLFNFETYILNDYLNSHSQFKNLSEITKLMIHHLICLSFEENIDVNELKQKYDEAIDYHALPSAMRQYQTIFYHYAQHNQAIDDTEFEHLINSFYELQHMDNAASLIKQLIFCGGHGSSILLNNLSQDQLHSLVNMCSTIFPQKISFLVLECCMSASHLNTFRPILSNNGYALCNFGEATARSYMDALEASKIDGSDLIDNITKSAKNNPFIGLYSNKKGTLYLPRLDHQVNTNAFCWKSDVRKSKLNALKSAGLNVKTVETQAFRDLLHNALNSSPPKNAPRLGRR